jgi:hypothetical protein
MVVGVEGLAHDRGGIQRSVFAESDGNGGECAAVGVIPLELAAGD